MKKTLSQVATIFSIAGSASAATLISEFEPNPAGGDPAMTNIELSGTPGTSFMGFFITLESDPGTFSGTIDRSTSISGTFDAMGILTVVVPDLENPSFTAVLLDNTHDPVAQPTGTDLDTDDDGMLDIALTGVVLDAIGIPDTNGEPLYGVSLGGADFAYTGGEPQLVLRAGSTGDWFAVNVLGDAGAFDINANAVTPDAPLEPFYGMVNPTSIPEPSVGLLSIFAGAFLLARRRR